MNQLGKGRHPNAGPPFPVWGRRYAQNIQKLIFAALPQMTDQRIIKQEVNPEKNFQLYNDNLHSKVLISLNRSYSMLEKYFISLGRLVKID